MYIDVTAQAGFRHSGPTTITQDMVPGVQPFCRLSIGDISILIGSSEVAEEIANTAREAASNLREVGK